MFRGFVQKQKTVITPNNLGVYIEMSKGVYGNPYPTFNFEKLGSFILIKGQFGEGVFPKNLTLPSFRGTPNNMDWGDKDYVRSMVGQHILIYVDYDCDVEFNVYGNITNKYDDLDGDIGFCALSRNEFMSAQCLITTISDGQTPVGVGGKECVYWKANMGTLRE